VSASPKSEISGTDCRIGIVVDAGPSLGYGHAVRCLRLANALADDAAVIVYPLSESCRDFFLNASPAGKFEICEPDWETKAFPRLVITDLRETHRITGAIHRNGSRHISIHDLGLAQCGSDVVIDGSITTLFPYKPDENRALFLGSQYMVTREPVARGELTDTVLVSFGGGSTSNFALKAAEEVWNCGLTPIMTRGFIGSSPIAISSSGVTLYDLIASGVPTLAVAFDRIQLRTAHAFHERGAVVSAGLVERLGPGALLGCAIEMLENPSILQRLSQVGQMLVDGKGLSRVVEIVRRQLWLTSQEKTYSVY